MFGSDLFSSIEIHFNMVVEDCIGILFVNGGSEFYSSNLKN